MNDDPDRPNPGQESAPPTLRELAMVLFRQRRLFLSVAGLIFVSSIVYAIAGASYRAELRILVRRGRSDPPVAAQQNAPPDFSRAEISEEELNSEVELLKDDDVIRNVVEDTGLASRDWLRWLRRNEDEGARVQRAAKRLSSRLKIESIKKTNLIGVSYDASDPQLAATVLRSLSRIYLEKHKQVHRPGGELQFFDEQTLESRRQLDDAKRKLLEFTEAHRVEAAAQQRDLTLQRLDAFEASYRQTEVEISEKEQRVGKLATQLAQLPERTTTQVRTADNPELLRSLKATLLDLELKKTQLLTKFEPNHRLVLEVEEQIAQARSAIDAAGLQPVRDQTTDKNSNYEWAQSELQKAQVDLQGLMGRRAATGSQVHEYQTSAEKLEEDAITQDDLVSSVKAAQDNYLLYVSKREEARMGNALDVGGIVNVAIAEDPVVPSLPVWPAAAVVMVGLVTAMTAGAGAAFGVDYLDPALRTPEEVFNCLEIPVLASLPAKTSNRLSA